MEAIFQQTIGKQIGNWEKMSFDPLQKEILIPFFDEYIFPVHAAIVDVITGVVEERRRTGHVHFHDAVQTVRVNDMGKAIWVRSPRG
jgi:hypothetical protein